MTLNSTCDNKKLSVIQITNRMPDGKIIISTTRHYYPKQTYQLKHGNHIFFQVLTETFYQLELFVIMD